MGTKRKGQSLALHNEQHSFLVLGSAVVVRWYAGSLNQPSSSELINHYALAVLLLWPRCHSDFAFLFDETMRSQSNLNKNATIRFSWTFSRDRSPAFLSTMPQTLQINYFSLLPLQWLDLPLGVAATPLAGWPIPQNNKTVIKPTTIPIEIWPWNSPFGGFSSSSVHRRFRPTPTPPSFAS